MIKFLLSLLISACFILDYHDLNSQTVLDSTHFKWEIKEDAEYFPFVSYDSDIGFGIGGKTFQLNKFGQCESIDAIIFASTGGERWSKMVFSLPDLNSRQGKIYDRAFDLTIEYDLFFKYFFYGLGNITKDEDSEEYTREQFEISAKYTAAPTNNFVSQIGVKFLTIRNYNLSDSGQMIYLLPKDKSDRATYLATLLSLRYDSRDNYINPNKGIVLQLDFELSPWYFDNKTNFIKTGFWFKYYVTLFEPNFILAMRNGFQSIIGSNIPPQFLLPIGGNQTLRGLNQDRYLDNISNVTNLEFRYPIFWRFGGILGVDIGQVWHDYKYIRFENMKISYVVGLRFFYDYMIIRADLGFCNDNLGFYLNFDHLF